MADTQSILQPIPCLVWHDLEQVVWGVAQVLKHGADSESWGSMDWGPFEQALFSGHVELARTLLEHGADARGLNK